MVLGTDAFLRLGLPARGKLIRLWRAQRPDLVHIATEGPLGYSALLAANRPIARCLTDSRRGSRSMPSPAAIST